jgi:hypothetical protein
MDELCDCPSVIIVVCASLPQAGGAPSSWVTTLRALDDVEFDEFVASTKVDKMDSISLTVCTRLPGSPQSMLCVREP